MIFGQRLLIPSVRSYLPVGARSFDLRREPVPGGSEFALDDDRVLNGGTTLNRPGPRDQVRATHGGRAVAWLPGR